MAQLPTKEELGEAVAAIEKKASKFSRAAAKWEDLHGRTKAALGVTAKVAPFTPVAGMAATYLTGRADAMVGTADVKNPVTIAVGIATWVGSGVSAYMGWSVPAVVAGAVATAALGALTHDVGYAAGAESKAAG